MTVFDNAGGRAESAELVEAMRAAARYRPDPDRRPVVLALPFTQSWRAVTTPARRVPSHGTHFGGQTYAFDFVAVDERGRSTDVRDWRSFVAAEPVDRFFGFGLPILAPAKGQVVAVHDGEPDLTARRSPVTALPYLLTQGSRLRRGFQAVVGNHVIVELEEPGSYVLLAHLRKGTVRVRPGDRIATGQAVGACGNSGNSTQPHLHLQVMDSVDLVHARGLPVAFRDYVAWSADGLRRVEVGVPRHRERVAPASS
jgi:murein DD-endopeptidase MepM/ murein hydrolase activator NlpD